MKIKNKSKNFQLLSFLTLAGIILFIVFFVSLLVLLKSKTTKSGIKAGQIKVKLVDADSARIITNRKVEIHSENGIRCFIAGCSLDEKEWKGITDTEGMIYFPKETMNTVTTITAEGYKSGRDLKTDSEKISDNYWTIDLDPDIKIDKFERRVKLIDRITLKSLPDTAFWFINDVSCLPPQCSRFVQKGITNSLGNYYYQIAKINNPEKTYVYVPGYRPVNFPLGWANYKVVLEK